MPPKRQVREYSDEELANYFAQLQLKKRVDGSPLLLPEVIELISNDPLLENSLKQQSNPGRYTCIICGKHLVMKDHLATQAHCEHNLVPTKMFEWKDKTTGELRMKEGLDSASKEGHMFKELCRRFSTDAVVDLIDVMPPTTKEEQTMLVKVIEAIERSGKKIINFDKNSMLYNTTLMSMKDLIEQANQNIRVENDGAAILEETEDSFANAEYNILDDRSANSNEIDHFLFNGEDNGVPLPLDADRSTASPSLPVTELNHISGANVLWCEMSKTMLNNRFLEKKQLPNCFRKPGNLNLIYDTTMDGDYVKIARQGNRAPWSVRAQDKIAWGRSISLENLGQQELLKQIRECADPNSEGKKTVQNQLVGYIERLLPYIMRSRGRLGCEVSALDLLCSVPVIAQLQRDAQSINVSSATLRQLTKAVKTLHNFLRYHLSITDAYLEPALQAKDRLEAMHILVMQHSQMEGKRMLLGHEAKSADDHAYQQQNTVSFVIISNLLRDDELFKRANSILRDCIAKGSVRKSEYMFVMNLLMAYITLTNCQRNEVCHKSKNGSILRVNRKKQSGDDREMIMPFPDSHKNIYIGIYKNKKNASASKYGNSGYFCWDERGKELIQIYFELRKMRAAELNLQGVDDHNKPLFIEFNGEKVNENLISGKFKSFFLLLGIYSPTTMVGCTRNRKSATQLEFDDYFKRLNEESTNPDLATAQQHSTQTAQKKYTTDKAGVFVQTYAHMKTKAATVAVHDQSEKEKLEWFRKTMRESLVKLEGKSDSEVEEDLEILEQDFEDEGGEDDVESVSGDSDHDEELLDDSDIPAMEHSDESATSGDSRGQRRPHAPFNSDDSNMGGEQSAKVSPVAKKARTEDTATPMMYRDALDLNEDDGPSTSAPAKRTFLMKAMDKILPKKPMEEDKKAAFTKNPLNKLAHSFRRKEAKKVFKNEKKLMMSGEATTAKKNNEDMDENQQLHQIIVRSNWMRDVLQLNKSATCGQPSESAPHELEGICGVPMSGNLGANQKSSNESIVFENELEKIAHNLRKKPISDADRSLIESGYTASYAFRSSKHTKDFFDRMDAEGVENFPWIHIAPTNGIGHGAFASMRLPASTIITCYSGRRVSRENSDAYKEWIRSMRTPDHADRLIDFVTSYDIECKCSNGSVHIIEGHRRTHGGRTVLGRYLNHTSCIKCLNVELRSETVHLRDVKGNIIESRNIAYLVAIRPIEENEQLFWNYHKKQNFNDFPDCAGCHPMEIGNKKDSYNGTISVSELEPMIGTDSTLLPERPFDHTEIASKTVEEKKILDPILQGWMNDLSGSQVVRSMAYFHPEMGTNINKLKPIAIDCSSDLLVKFSIAFFHARNGLVMPDNTNLKLNNGPTRALDMTSTVRIIFKEAETLGVRLLFYVSQGGEKMTALYVLTPKGTEGKPIEGIIGAHYDKLHGPPRAHFHVMGYAGSDPSVIPYANCPLTGSDIDKNNLPVRSLTIDMLENPKLPAIITVAHFVNPRNTRLSRYF